MAKIQKENKYFTYYYKRSIKISLRHKLGNIKRYIKAIVYKILMNTFVPKRKESTKYNVSICGIFKNEGPYLKEWIEFHKIVGIEHFYLYNNNSEDNFREILLPYIEKGTVTLVEWPKNHAQNESYYDCIEKYSKETKWLGFIDLDEFVVPKSTDDIYSFLKPFEKNRPAVLMYWKIFGSSGMVERDLSGLVIEDFTVCWKKYADMGKCFLNTKYIVDKSNKNSALNHLLWTKLSKILLPPVNIFNKISYGMYNPVKTEDFPIQINHYFSKTYKEYCLKKVRGDAYFEINPRDDDYFYYHEYKNTSVDYCAYKYLVKLKNSLMNFDKKINNKDE